jgi:hypothetical protein
MPQYITQPPQQVPMQMQMSIPMPMQLQQQPSQQEYWSAEQRMVNSPTMCLPVNPPFTYVYASMPMQPMPTTPWLNVSAGSRPF